MMEIMAMTTPRPILLTGASGNLGRSLAQALAAHGWTVRLTDITPFPDPLPKGATFTRVDLNDGVPLLRLAEGCGTILHFGGVSVDRPFEEVMGPNLKGLYHVYEAARREGARVVFASSNHSVGFHERASVLDHDCDFRPDSFYGLSKAFGELMGRMYWDKHGVENVNIRIGSSFPEPVDARMLATWLSYGDLGRLIERCVLAEAVGHSVIWGTSKNSRMTWWRRDQRERLGWAPEDSADHFAGQLEGKVSGSPVQERYQGGVYTVNGYSREAPSKADPFAI
jgi:uronate dehydrogenase